jgi:RNA-directed DNA polymerase
MRPRDTSDKTKVIYCKDSNRKGKHSETSFEFLGYEFKPRLVKSRDNKMFVSFTPAVSSSAGKAMRERVRQWKLKYRVELSLEEIATYCNPGLRESEVVSLNVSQYRNKGLYEVLRHKSKRVSQKIPLPQESRSFWISI